MQGPHSHSASRAADARLQVAAGESGTLRFGTLAVPVHYYLNVPDGWGTPATRENPAHYMMAGDGLSAMVWVHESVPEDFREVLLYHEVVEAELTYGHGIERARAHNLARELENIYARNCLDPERFDSYVSWRAALGLRQQGA